MELVYLWVEEYKNIKNQGFNFSPRFECEYDESSNELTIKENKDYVSIFPKNINITAIVGENGSGKSALLHEIMDNIIVFKIDEKYYSFCKQTTKIITSLDIEKNKLNIDDYIIYLDQDIVKINIEKGFFGELKNMSYKNSYHSIVKNSNKNLNINIATFNKNILNLILDYHKKFDTNIFVYKPQNIKLSDHIFTTKDTSEKWERINSLINKIQSKSLTKEKFLTFIYYQLAYQIQIYAQLPEINTIEDILENETTLLSHLSDIGYKDADSYKIFGFLDSLKEKFTLEKFNPIYNEYKEIFLQLQNIGYISFDLIDEKDRYFFSLSQGERKFFIESLMIYDAVTRNPKNDILLVLDEPDVTMNPDWQKRYINELIKLLSKNFSKKRFHIIVTTHSPFLLSDIAKENIIFLKKDENENCKDVTKETEINTFGANIHTLLSNGFFMSDGLMGEFAKNKIEEIKEFYEKVKKSKNPKEEYKKEFEDKIKKFNHIQSIIGEPFLQTIIKNYLDELEQIFDNETYKKNKMKEFLDQFEAEELQKYLDEKNAKA